MPATLSDKARAFLHERRFAVLATLNKDGSPQLTTMWYLLEGDTIMMNTKAGRIKDLNMKRDPRIAICVEDGYNFVTISGTVSMNEDQETAHWDIYRLAVRYNSEEKAKQQLEKQFSKEYRITLYLSCENVIEYLS
jgi:PPOX class probable F420-dependent enzyme